MKITVINGTQVKGCTYAIKENFLSKLKEKTECEITQYYLPKDCPQFCCGCKTCYLTDIDRCPHAEYTVPIWDSFENSDLIIFSSPVYVFHTTGQIKALLDHFGNRWMAHSPHGEMFKKQAVILTNAIGAGMKSTAKDIKDSLDFWGIARIYTVKQGLGEADYSKVSEKVKSKLDKKLTNCADKVVNSKNIRPSFKTKCLFYVMKIAQNLINKSQLKKGNPSTKDYEHWKSNGWLDGVKPW